MKLAWHVVFTGGPNFKHGWRLKESKNANITTLIGQTGKNGQLCIGHRAGLTKDCGREKDPKETAERKKKLPYVKLLL